MATGEAPDDARDALGRIAPALRRFARALAVGRDRVEAGDALAQSALERIGDGEAGTMKLRLFQRVVLAHRARPAQAVEPDARRRTGRGAMAQALERLPLDQREAVLLVVLENFSYDDAASIAGVPRSSLVARLVRARLALAAQDGDDVPQRAPHLRLVK